MSSYEAPIEDTGAIEGFGALVLTVGQSVPDIYVTRDELEATTWLATRILECGEDSIGLLSGTVGGKEVLFGMILKNDAPVKVSEDEALMFWKKINGK